MPRLNFRIAKGRRAWYFSRTVSVCPHCGRAVRHSKKKEAWLLLMLPLLLAMVFESGYATPIPLAVYVLLGIVALAGVVLFRVTTRLEKDNAI